MLLNKYFRATLFIVASSMSLHMEEKKDEIFFPCIDENNLK
jgi:hypothetical protein